VKTTKYTLLTWAPLSLFMQFKRAANVYFLYITVLTSMSFSPKPPASMIGTFALVLFFTMCKEAYDDIIRAKSDKELNQRATRRIALETGALSDCRWEDLRVGDIVRVEKDEEVPADLLLINAPKDIVFVSTMNLDGETNLKDRELAITKLSYEELADFKAVVRCDAPDPSLDRWEGLLSTKREERDLPCSIKNLLLRGVTLKNTEYAHGIVLYVGNHTKIMMNAKKPPNKVTRLMLMINKMLYSVFALQFCIIALFTGLSMAWQNSNADKARYLDISTTLSAQRIIFQFFTYQVAYSHMIPISLYVMIEMAKLCLAKIINNDVRMFFPEDLKYA
jgi:magnesium-transporting ATPase (P-type)